MKTRSQIEDMVRNASYTRDVMTFLCQNNLDPDKVNRVIHRFKYTNSSEWLRHFSKAGYITQMTAREQLTDFCKTIDYKNPLFVRGVGQSKVDLSSGFFNPNHYRIEWRFIALFRKQLKQILSIASRLKGSDINLKNLKFDGYTLQMEVRPLKENNRTARISFKPNTKNSLSICECLKSQLTEAFKYMDVVAAVQSKILPHFERNWEHTTTYELDMIVSFKYEFLRKDEIVQEKKQEVQNTLNSSNYSSNDPKFWMYSSSNIDACKLNKVSFLPTENSNFKPVEKWHADAIEKSLKAVDDELVKATNEVLEAEKVLKQAQSRVQNLTKQRSKLNNALNALN
ncbi:thioredoxin [Salmonella phage SG1]|uniref:Thioredoxin n=1 Tax=Salmonella phage SG1 TaxID=2025823 RepID=A0A249XWB9_9CAUD|nr:thioredoxin [Salmonella phage SG1]ASZ76271.1 thioredoxin [Salmonella phage SG1]